MDARNAKRVALPVAALIVLSIGGYQAWLRTPPAMPESADDVEALLASDRYTRLSNADKRPYQERMNEMWGGLDADERRRLGEQLKDNPDARQQAMEQGMRSMYTTMILRQDKAARDAMLDMMINRMESPDARQRRQAQMANRDKEKEQQMVEQMHGWLDKGDPQTMGYGSEFFKLLQDRREERGLPPL